LLRQFNIRLAVVRDLSDPPSAEFDSIMDAITSVAGRVGSALDGLVSAASGQARSASTLSGMGRYLGPLAGAGSEFLTKSKSLLDTVRTSVQSVTGTIDDTLRPVFDLTRDIQQAGRNIFHATDVIAGVPNHVVNEINAIAGNLHGAYCNIVNGFDRIESIFDLDPLFGASNCSSTGGGRPISPWENANPFESLSPSVPPAPQTTASRDAMRWAQSLDPVASPQTAAHAADRLNRINEGLLV
jgi:hypothetical protein